MANMTAADLIKNNFELYSLPDTVYKLINLVNDPDHTNHDAAEIICQDPGITMRLLKIVNSPFYNFPAQVNSIEMAITILGSNQLRNLVLATSVINQFSLDNNSLLSTNDFWRHSVGCGTAARILAGFLEMHNGEELFTAGLLHDIGHMVMVTAMPEETAILYDKSGAPGVDLATIETAEFGFDHAEVGGALMEHWNLPSSIIEAVAFHHSPQKASQYRTNAAVIHIANLITNAAVGTLPCDGPRTCDPWAWKILNVDGDILQQVEEKLNEKMSDFLQMFVHDKAA
ncbi:MAG: HDOD domain-containing protein [Gammaproteobacteria bacterium]|nr:MAG: HDOD domain-containing protein [Gammaproteobacteria bacterium]